MILSGRDIELYINAGKIKIIGVQPKQFQQNGVDLILESVRLGGDSDKSQIPAHEGFQSGLFYLGCTREWIELPDDLMAFVELRSTWARRGLMIPPTVVDAGFKGDLTLEIAAFNYVPIPYGERFAHLIFAKTTGPCVPYAGKYLNQVGITEARPDETQ